MENAKKVQIIKQWTVKKWLFWKDTIKVRAEQVESPEMCDDMMVFAKVTIYINDKIVHEADIPWLMPRGELLLAQQVYLLAKDPRYEYSRWQPILELFSRKCENFSPPDIVWWSQLESTTD